ncbi:transcription antitermination factor NusB [Rickettsiales bacterium]|nr:transcription antitermination factor NusB [Rickettsiales bacterium]
MSQSDERPEGLEQRFEARLAAVKALYASEIELDSKKPSQVALDIISYYHEEIDEVSNVKIDDKFFVKIVEGVCQKKSDLDEIIPQYLGENWKYDRIGLVLQSILRAALYEILMFKNISHKTIIDEYLTVTSYYFDDKEIGFVNGILDKMAKFYRD